MGRLRTLAMKAGLIEERTVGLPSSFAPSDRTIPTNGELGGFVHSGEAVSETTALNLIAFFACVRKLADTVASLPWDAFRREGETRKEVEPAPALLRRPSDGVTVFDWKHQMMVSLAMRGNFYGLIVDRDHLEFPTRIVPLHPDWVYRTPERREGVPTGRIVTRIRGEVVSEEDLFHVKGFTLPGASEGLSPLDMARHSIGLGLAAQRFGSMWFRDGASPSGQLTTEQALTDEQAKRNQQEWIKTHGGRRLPAMMSNGLKYEPISITPEESQFLATRQFSVKEMAMLVGIPPHMIGDVERSTSWGTGIEQQSIGFVTYDLGGWLTRVEAALTDVLPRGQFVKFNVAALLRGDTKSRYEAYRLARESGWLNVDEIRELEDRPPLPDGLGEDYLQPLNYAPLGSDPREDDDG